MSSRVLRLTSTIVCLCLSIQLAYARALPLAESATSTTASGDSSTTTSPSTSSSSSPTSTNRDGSPGGSINVEVWAPLVGIVAVIALMILYTCFRKNSMNASMIAATRTANAAAETSNASGTSGTTPGARRRPRRTPSQISTRSLPAYMTVPGDQEIVLARGGIRRNRSRPDMGEGEMSDDEYMGDDDDMDEQSRSLSQADRPLLSDASMGVSDRRRLGPPERYSSRGTTSFETVRMGSEDSQHGLLRDEPEDMDSQDAGTTYMFGEGTTGGQLYDDEEHVEMRELAGGVSVGSASGSSAGSVSGRGGVAADARPRAHTASSSPPRTATLPPPSGRAGFFSSISSILGNSLSSVAYSFSGMNTSLPGPITGGSSYNPMTGSSRATERASAPRSDATPVPIARATTNTRTATARQSTSGTTNTTGSSQLLALPPPYEGSSDNNNNSIGPTTDSPGQQQQHNRSRSRSSPRPSVSSARPSFFRNRSPSGSHPSDSTISVNNTSSQPLSHARNASGSTTSLTISAPLAHTVTRSTFAYPASGPTNEQIKFLSSREALGRFGMPYGEEAVAAARAARSVAPTNQPPPPSFEDVAGNGSSGTMPSTAPGSSSVSSNPSSEPTQVTSPTSLVESPSSFQSSSSNYPGHGPRRTDSVASKVSVRSNRSVVGGPRGPRNSVRRSTLGDRERSPRPSMDSVDTIDSFGMDAESSPSNQNTIDQEGIMEDISFWASAADQIGNSENPRTQQQQPQARRPTLQSLPKLIVDAQPSSTENNYSQRNQQPIIPTTAPRGFVMSSPPASPTPTTSTNPHGGLNELGVPVITFAPATPSAESHGHGLG